MANENTIIDNEATQIVKPTTQPNKTTAAAADNSSRSDGPGFKEVMIGGAVGLVLGGVGTSLSSFIKYEDADHGNKDENHDKEVNHNHADSNGESHVAVHPDYLDDNIAFASNVDDQMSFSEAFAAARAEVGPGGVFEWHGNIYGTYLKDEWDNMSQADKNEYASHINWNDHTTDLEVADVHYASIESDAEVLSVEDADAYDSEVEILGVEHIVDDYGNEVAIGGMNIDGNDIVLIDVDGGDFDYAIADINGDDMISATEIEDISSLQISVDEFEQQYEIQNDIMPTDDMTL